MLLPEVLQHRRLNQNSRGVWCLTACRCLKPQKGWKMHCQQQTDHNPRSTTPDCQSAEEKHFDGVSQCITSEILFGSSTTAKRDHHHHYYRPSLLRLPHQDTSTVSTLLLAASVAPDCVLLGKGRYDIMANPFSPSWTHLYSVLIHASPASMPYFFVYFFFFLSLLWISWLHLSCH